MNKGIQIISTMALLLGSHSVFAIPADPALRSYRQPDGTVIQYLLSGDEFGHSVVDLLGRPLRFDAASRAFHVMSEAELSAQQQAAPRRAPEPGTQRRGFYPTTGKRHSLVFLIEFSDLGFTTVGDDPHQFYTRMLNEEGFSDFGATGSAHDYYLSSSQGLFDPTFDVVGPIRLSKPAAYYGENSAAGRDFRQAEPLYEACQLADSLGLVDFTQYDDDQNGIVDNIFYFYAGFGEADTGFDSTIWPHSWNLESAELPLTLQGKTIYSYACSNEIRYEEGVAEYKPTGIGTFVHEFAHVLGLPDLYNTVGGLTSMFTHTPDLWSVMDKGPYSNDTRTPPSFSSFERYSVGWLTPEVLNSEADSALVLPDLQLSNKAYLVEVPNKENEYFLLENRQLADWDTYLPGHGLLIWHIDYDSLRWNSNSPNNESRQLVDVYEADGDYDSSNYASDVMPGASNITSLHLLSWAGEQVTSPAFVSETDGEIRFLIEGGHYQAAQPQSLQVSAISSFGFDLAWEPVPNATSYSISISAQGQQVQSRNVTSARLSVSGLQPATPYDVEVIACVGTALSEPARISVTTAMLPFAERTPVTLAATDVQSDGFTAHWEALPDADGYLLTLCQLQASANSGQQGYDFSDKADGLPMLWQSSSSTYYAISGYYGAASPSLRFSKDQDYLYIAYPEATITSLTFWTRGQKAQGSLDIEWQATTDADWQLLRNVPLSAEGETIHLTLDQEAAALRILYHRDGGFVVIDDVLVKLIAQEHTPLPGYADLPVDNVLQYTFSELLPKTTYTYRVKATSADLVSLPSAEMYVETLQAESTDPGDEPGDKPGGGDTPTTGPTHKILIEEFTGQDCIYCPSGAENINAAVAGYEDRVIEVKHHAGYYPDYLTSQADIEYASLFGISSAPTGIINRAEFGTTLKLNFTATTYPDSIRSTIVRELEKPDYVTVNIETTYDETTRLVTARVYGHQLQPLPVAHPRLNVWVTESGYKGYQASPTGTLTTYMHSNYQRAALTDIKGDLLTFDTDGNYEQTFTYTIPDTYPAYTQTGVSATKSTEAHPLTTRIVAFVSHWSRADDCEVFNANSALVGRNAIDAAAIDEVNSDTLRPMPTYDLQGRRVSTDHRGLQVRDGKIVFVR